jgi:hypothetical protein
VLSLAHRINKPEQKKMKTGKFVIVHSKFGYDMFISSTKCDVSDKVDGALVFDYSQDNPAIKVAAYVRSTGFDGWEARAI